MRTGKLIRTFVFSRPASPASVADPALNSMIDRIAAEKGIEAPLVHSIIKTESNYNPAALSPKGAQGIMQLIPSTAKRFGVEDAYDPEQNIQGGVSYLKFLLNHYRDDYRRVIAAYNAGEAAVDKYHGIPPFQETRNYVSTVARYLKAAREQQKVGPKLALNAVNAVPNAAETTRPVVASTGTDGRIYYRTP